MKGNSFVPFMIHKGDGSTLNLDFTKMSELDSRFTFTRSTTATYIDSSGYVATMAAAATNDPTKARLDYNPTTLAANGLLIEGSATNLSTYSADFTHASWTKAQSGITAAAATSPENAATGSLLAENVTTFEKHALQKSFAVTAGSVYTFSVFLKEPLTDSRRYVALQLADGQATAARYTVNFDLLNGVVLVAAATNGTAGAPTDTSYSITAFPNGWYRCVITMKHVASPSYPVVLLNNLATLPGGTNQPAYSPSAPYKGIYVWGAQVELGTGASSYIPTVASQVTRASDECYMADISSFNYSNTSASMAMQFMYAQQSTGYIEQIGFMTATDQPVIESLANGLSFFTSVRGASLSTGGLNEVSRTFTLNTAIKYSYSVDTTTDPILRVNLNSSASSANKSGTGNMYTATRFVFGRLPASTYGSNFGSITIKSVKYWPTTKTAAELAALTL